MLMRFLNKSDARKLKLFQYLENSSSLAESKNTISNETDLSEFLINKTVLELNDDFHKFGIQENFRIFSNRTTVRLDTVGEAVSETLLSHYLNKSIKYSLIKECFFEQLSSIYEFATSHYLSHNPVYKEFKELKILLEEFDIDITNDFRILGFESEVREFMFLILFKEHYINEDVFSLKITEIYRDFEKVLMKSCFIKSPSARMQVRLKVYLSVVITRVLNGHQIVQEPFQGLESIEGLSLVSELTKWFSGFSIQQNQTQIDRESLGVIRFLISEGWLSEEYINAENSYISQLDSDFVVCLESQLTFSPESHYLLAKELKLIHYQLLSFSLICKYEYQKLDVTYFLETCPEYFHACRDYLNKSKRRSILWESKEFLFYRYLIMMISCIPLREVLDPIYLCIDFSLGQQYNHLIQQHIEKLLDLNFVFQSYVDEKTELILSDLPIYRKFETEYILWIIPPRPVDWANLMEKTLEIRQKNYCLVESK